MLFVAALWGFAEATLFFIVPDVLVSFVALRFGLRAALEASLTAAIAAAAGGLVMYAWGAVDATKARAVLAAIPAIDAQRIAAAAARFSADGYTAMLAGAFSGIPYKIYAVLAGEAGRGLPLFLALTPFVRLPRFVLAALLTAAVDRVVAPRLPIRVRMALLACFWIVFYACYFILMG